MVRLPLKQPSTTGPRSAGQCRPPLPATFTGTAGEAGAGFAVVADEVRNLAIRAAEAAKNTSGLIEDIVKKIRNGEKLVGATNEAFKEMMGSSGKVVRLIAEIAGSSQEQSLGIDQVSRAVAEMNNLTQQNAAGAEELASIMAMFKTDHDSSEILHDRKKTAEGKQIPSIEADQTPQSRSS